MNHFTPWHENPITVVDFETTGVDPSECMPVQLAAVRFVRGEVDSRYTALINPGIAIPPGATAVHGITDSLVRADGVMGPSDAIIECEEWIGDDSVMCAYNEPYDREIMARFGIYTEEGPPWIDPLVMVREFDRYERGKGRHRLTETCRRWGVQLDDAHSALGDATATGKLLWAMRSKLGDITYSELIRRQRIHAAAQEKRFQEWKAANPIEGEKP